jgi:hypothetical protein
MSLLAPSNLLIWLPGLLFLASLVYLAQQGATVAAARFAPPVLFVIGLLVAVLVPSQEMDKAVRFANAHEAHAGAPVARYSEIDYAAKDAWLKTALPEDQRGAGGLASDDLFSFGEPAEPAPAPAAAADSGAANLVYQPEKGFAWMVLVLFLIMGSLYFLQDIKSFTAARQS